MTKLSRLLIVGLSILVFSAGCYALEVFPLDQVVPGLVGVGKTVIQGREIKEFAVEVLGVVPQSPPTPDLILVRLSGDVIDQVGGIASGMSGSPVYVDGALLGAISYGYSLSDHRICLITPAQAMFELLDRIALQAGGEQSYPELPHDVVALSAPLVVNGIRGRALEYLRSSLRDLRFAVEPGLAHSVDVVPAVLEPGSAFAVQLLKGDFQAAAFGTVTHVEDDGRFVGFGHPFTHKGQVNFLAADAYVHYTMPSLDFPYKILSVGEPLGGVFEDRAAGVAGALGQMPSYLPVTVKVYDKDQGRGQTFKVDVVTDPSLMIPLVLSSAYQGVDAVLDRVGDGTSYVRMEFDSPDIPQPMIRENLFYSDSDIAVWSLTDLNDGLELLANNSLQEVELTEITIEIEIQQARRTASIEQAVPRLSTVMPGDSLEVEVTIRPYRQEPEKRVLRIEIPEDTMPGPLTVTVRSGAAGYYVTKPPVHKPLTPSTEEEEEVPHTVATGAESLEHLINGFMDREKNNEIVAEFYPFIDSFATSSRAEESPEEEVETSGVEAESRSIQAFRWNEGTSEVQSVRLTTQYVMEGMASFDIEVVAAEY
jgi:hypothetical protein